MKIGSIFFEAALKLPQKSTGKQEVLSLMFLNSIWTYLKRGTDINPLAHGMTVAAGISLFAMMIMMTLHVIGRKLAMPVPGAFEASEQLMVVVFSFPLAEISLKKGNIVFDLISRKFPPRIKRRMDMIGNLVGLLLFAPLAYQAWVVALKMFSMREYRQGIIDFPIWPFRLLIAVGLTVFTYQLVVGWIREEKEIWSQRPVHQNRNR
jgi:TRAP-type mannitol/chloroaromatic compound transport system permease small subunit